MDTLTLCSSRHRLTLGTTSLGYPLVYLVAELTTLVDPTQLNQEIEDFNISYPINLDDALNLFSLPPVAGVGTEPMTTITGPVTATITTVTTAPVTTSSRTRPVTSTRTRPVTTAPVTTTGRPRPVTSTTTRPVTMTTTVPAGRTTMHARWRAGAGMSTTTLTVITPSTHPRVAGKQLGWRPPAPSPPSPNSFPPSSDEDGDDDDDDRQRGLRWQLD